MEQDKLIRLNENAFGIAKAGIAAIVLLNSGAWLALLSQASSLLALKPQPEISAPFLLWASGATIGTLTWVFFFWNAHAFIGAIGDPTQQTNKGHLNVSKWAGVTCALIALCCFLLGTYCLSKSFT